MDTITPPYSLIKLSQDLLLAVKLGSGTTALVQQLQTADMRMLQWELRGDDAKKAFWLNMYNAFVQIALLQNPGSYQSRNRFFGRRFIEVAGKKISLNLIEHGILRRSLLKWGLGYLANPFPSSFEKKMRVSQLDCRIHFALNCGAQSCPPIAFYTPLKINTQLAMATANYLGQQAMYIPAQNKWLLPALIKWFWGDFGGRRGILFLLQKHHPVAGITDAATSLSFTKYNWSLLLKSFVER
jgi:Protein of unknown function, DUF547